MSFQRFTTLPYSSRSWVSGLPPAPSWLYSSLVLSLTLFAAVTGNSTSVSAGGAAAGFGSGLSLGGAGGASKGGFGASVSYGAAKGGQVSGGTSILRKTTTVKTSSRRY